MSFGNGEKPPTNKKYADAVSKQKSKSSGGGSGKGGKSVPASSKARQFLFLGSTRGGIDFIFVCYGADNKSAISNAVAYCEKNDLKYCGWVTDRKSAYSRVV